MAARLCASPARARRPRSAVVGEGHVALDGHDVGYVLKRSAAARHVRLEVRTETGLTVVAPRAYDLAGLPDLLQRKSRWVLDKLAKHSQSQRLHLGRPLQAGGAVAYLGEELRVATRAACGGGDGGSVEVDRGRLVVTPANGNARLDLLVERWYRGMAASLLKKRADSLSARLGLGYRRLFIRGQRTRWASCSHLGNLTFNWKLLMAPEPVIDYVVIHELLHLKEMNHSKAFWDLVTRHCPGWQAHRRWLKEHDALLRTAPCCP